MSELFMESQAPRYIHATATNPSLDMIGLLRPPKHPDGTSGATSVVDGMEDMF